MTAEQEPLACPQQLRYAPHFVVRLVIHQPCHRLASTPLVVDADTPIVRPCSIHARTHRVCRDSSDNPLLPLALPGAQQPILHLPAWSLNIEYSNVLLESTQDLASIRRKAQAERVAHFVDLVVRSICVAQCAGCSLAQVNGMVLAAGNEAARCRILPSETGEKTKVQDGTAFLNLRIGLHPQGGGSKAPVSTCPATIPGHGRTRDLVQPQRRIVVGSQKRAPVGAPADTLREVVAPVARRLWGLQNAMSVPGACGGSYTLAPRRADCSGVSG
mmetsp:Transcript_84678/g.220458  ORF Transcript_84678/g.220458 Transcript_84678/m.220458 type:complete len:273 (-) Transcript_84678:119-937(-)